MNDSSISLFRLEKPIKENLVTFNNDSFKKKLQSFYLNDALNLKYIQPLFSELYSNTLKDKQPKILLISAAGATGKSELTNYLSASLKMPIFNLSKHNPVASNSLTGLFFESLGHVELGYFVEKLKNGQSVLIIDALDEGYLKTTAQGFDSFLDEIAEIGFDAKSTAFILLGRTQIMEHCMLYFEEKKIETKLICIEPFTVDQAQDFIDKQINEEKYLVQYKELRDFIINSVEGFFKNQSEINKKQYKSFIGYAPVLLSITKLLQATSNYKSLYEELVRKNDKGVNLIISIVEYILKRDKEEKINKLLLPELLSNRDANFSSFVYENAYTLEEQCSRLINLQIYKQFYTDLTEDKNFNGTYEERINEWIKEHPFLENNKIQNAVFESYIIAKLILSSKCEDAVYEYLTTKYKDAFMLFFIYEKLSNNKKITSRFFPFLYNSLKSLDDKFAYSSLSIEEKQSNENIVNCDVEFSISDSKEKQYNFEMEINNLTDFYVGSSLSNANIYAPINLLLNGKRCELSAPVNINCQKITISTNEFILEKGFFDNSDGIVLECQSCKVDYSKSQNPSIDNYLSKKQNFQIISECKPDFPFSGYFVNNEDFEKLDTQLKDKYLKLRKIIVLFRSHSKGRMARFKDKIETPRVIGYGLGKKVLNSLVDSKIIYLEEMFYFIDTQKIHSLLGLSYNEIRLREINDKTIEFLKSIKND